MPWTFSHPLAVVPIHRLFRERLNFAGLVIGSLSPDFAYYGKQFPLATFAHTLPGTFCICLPAGLVVLALFYALRPALSFILPQPHRAALMPLAMARPRLSLRNLGIAAGSVMLGAWSHTFWDSFTHDGGWAVEQIPILSKPLFPIANTQLPLSYLLQQGSTFGAATILGFLYFRWLRRQPPYPHLPAERISDRWRYLLWGAVSLTATLIATPLALQIASRYEGYLAFRVFVFRIGIYSTMAFVPLLVICSIALYSRFRDRPIQAGPNS